MNALVIHDASELVDDLAPLECEDVGNARDLQHFSYLSELFNVDVVKLDLAFKSAHCFLHRGLQDLAGTAPSGGALDDDWLVAVQNLVPLLHFLHGLDVVGLVGFRRGSRAEADFLGHDNGTLLIRGLRRLLWLLGLNEKGPHVGPEKHL